MTMRPNQFFKHFTYWTDCMGRSVSKLQICFSKTNGKAYKYKLGLNKKGEGVITLTRDRVYFPYHSNQFNHK